MQALRTCAARSAGIEIKRFCSVKATFLGFDIVPAFGAGAQCLHTCPFGIGIRRKSIGYSTDEMSYFKSNETHPNHLKRTLFQSPVSISMNSSGTVRRSLAALAARKAKC